MKSEREPRNEVQIDRVARVNRSARIDGRASDRSGVGVGRRLVVRGRIGDKDTSRARETNECERCEAGGNDERAD